MRGRGACWRLPGIFSASLSSMPRARLPKLKNRASFPGPSKNGDQIRRQRDEKKKKCVQIDSEESGALGRRGGGHEQESSATANPILIVTSARGA